MTVLVVGSIVAGIAAGASGLLPPAYVGRVEAVIEGALLLVLLLAGVGVGRKREAWEALRRLGWRALLLPAGVALFSVAGAMVAGAVLRMPLREAGAVGAGLGWYSLTGILLTRIHSAELGALGFLANVARELIAIASIPVLARRLGGLAAVSTGGATTMDVTLPVVARATRGEMTAVALLQGTCLTLLVPLLLPLILHW
ncbi:MAG: lysine exporter LysO family protein [candidate division NC10 bacterium]|nr:lysine exporter LysO family protein [candidate division NC10 bacterium]MBI4391434.1 lysine exporter LysO family protein [candidate division NC10 bacterium]